MAELPILLRDFTNSEIVDFIEKFTKAENERSVLRGKFIGLLRMDDLQMLYGEYGRVGTQKINKLCKNFRLWADKEIKHNFKLEPCPFCGGEAVLEPYKARKGCEATIQCNGGCLLYMTTITYDTEEEAVETVVKRWNTRTPKEKDADKPKITCLNCKHLMFSDMYGECNKQLRIVHPSDTCEFAEPKERGGEK